MILLSLLACPVDVSADMEAQAPTAAEAKADGTNPGTSAPGKDAPPPEGEIRPPPPGLVGPQGPPLDADGHPIRP